MDTEHGELAETNATTPDFGYPDIFEEMLADEELDRRGDEEAEADYVAGRYATQEQVRIWMQTWGKDGPIDPPPAPWLK